MKYSINDGKLRIQYSRRDGQWKELVGTWELFTTLANERSSVQSRYGITPSIDNYKLVPQALSDVAEILPKKLPTARYKRVLYRLIGRKPITPYDFDSVTIEFEPDARKEFPGYTRTLTGLKTDMNRRVEELRRELTAENWMRRALNPSAS